MKFTSTFLILILFFTSCSKQAIEEKPLPQKIQIQGIIKDNLLKKAQLKYGFYARKRYESFNTKLIELQNASDALKLKEINNFFNNVPYGDDIDIWNKKDYWATPLEFLGKDKGDCEDYVIAKYFALRNLGIDAKKLYFSYVKSKELEDTHMVLSYFETPYSVPLILDSINSNILPADKRIDLTPIYNFNSGLLYSTDQNGKNSHRVTDIKKNQKVGRMWDGLIKDIKKDKL